MGGPPVGGPMDMGGGGMGGAPGGMPGDMGGGMGAAPGGAAPGGAPGAVAGIGGSSGKILTKGKASKMKPMAEEVAQPSGIRLTSLEQIMAKMLVNMRFSMRLPFMPWMQYPLGPYRVDFAIPQIKMAIECDGDAWHNNPEKKSKDQMRDALLAKYGWTTVRFREADLQENKDAVQNTVSSLLLKLWRKAYEAQGNKKAASAIPAMTKTNIVAEGGIDDISLANVSQDFYILSQPLDYIPMDVYEYLEMDVSTLQSRLAEAEEAKRLKKFAQVGTPQAETPAKPEPKPAPATEVKVERLETTGPLETSDAQTSRATDSGARNPLD